uniref:Farnesoic acid O-methyl transferase domain-containing protein n=1 Tax=Anopheles epiroticus TaxID=199890 RepID=A0A182PT61_9DIPT
MTVDEACGKVEAAMALRVLFGLLCLGAQAFLSLHGGAAVGENCEQHTTTTSQFEEYFDIDRIGNNRSEANVVDLTLFVQVRNMQEELAILLSAANRSRQHPDYGRTYEVRVSNVYTVIYKETLRMSAHHSHNFNFFPGEQFRLRIQITRAGHITVSIPGLQKSLILTVHDERPPIEVSYISFGSRMNAYPVTFYFNCVDAAGGTVAPAAARKTRPADGGAGGVAKPGEEGPQPGQAAGGREEGDENLSSSRRPVDDERPLDVDEDGNAGGGVGEGERTRQEAGDDPATKCPVCPKPEKCEVVVKACSDTSKDLLMQASGPDGEKQKYFFYFNVYLSSKGEKGKGPVADAGPNQIAK